MFCVCLNFSKTIQVFNASISSQLHALYKQTGSCITGHNIVQNFLSKKYQSLPRYHHRV